MIWLAGLALIAALGVGWAVGEYLGRRNWARLVADDT